MSSCQTQGPEELSVLLLENYRHGLLLAQHTPYRGTRHRSEPGSFQRKGWGDPGQQRPGACCRSVWNCDPGPQGGEAQACLRPLHGLAEGFVGSRQCGLVAWAWSCSQTDSGSDHGSATACCVILLEAPNLPALSLLA